MSFVLSMLLRADDSNAKRGLAATQAEAKKTGSAIGDLSAKGRAASAGLNTMAASADRTEAQLRQLATAEKAAVATTVSLETANRRAAARASNLTAQFNDIGVMLASGQNPLQLAIQQGTQIVQVIGPLGATRAVRELGGAFLKMLNPVSLITIGSIAAGAAMFQWLTNSGEEAMTLEDALSEVTDAVDELRAATENLSGTKIDELSSKYGRFTTGVLELVQAQRALAEIDAIEALTTAHGTLLESLKDNLSSFNSLAGAGRNLRSVTERLKREYGLTGKQIDAMRDAIDKVESAAGPAEQVKAYRELRTLIVDAVGGYKNLSAEQKDFVRGLIDAENAARSVAFLVGDTVSLTEDLVSAADSISFDKAISGASMLVARLSDGLQRIGDIAAAVGEAGQRALTDQQKITLQELELDQRRGGASDVAIAGALAAQREQFALDDKGIPPAVVDKLVADARARGEKEAANSAALRNLRTPDRAGSKANRAESNAIADLLEKQQQALALAGETDPIQKELIRNREALAGATDAERAAVTQLIAERIREEQQTRQVLELHEYFENTAFDAIDGLILQGKSLSDVMGDVEKSIARAVLQATLLGQGPLAGLFGGSSTSGGIIGSLVSAIIPRKADGGYLTGPGGERSDGLLIYGSPGEMMMNAPATKRYRHVLEKMNAGSEIAGFADGGYITGPPVFNQSSSAARAARDGMNAPTVQNNYFNVTTQDARSFSQDRVSVARGAQRLIAQASRFS